VGGAEGRELVERASSDPLTQADVRRGLGEMLTPPAKAEPSGQTDDKGSTANPASTPTKP
jgi:hypothetical protein